MAQAAWAKGWERLAQLRDENLVYTWVNTIALNTYRGLIRREPRSHLIEQHHATCVINLAAIDLARVLARCRPDDRRLLEMSMHGATTEEMAGAHGVSPTAARLRLLRARRHAFSRVQPAETTGMRSGRRTLRESSPGRLLQAESAEAAPLALQVG